MISSIRISLKAAMIAALAFAAVSCGTRNDKTSTGLPFGINLSVAEFGSDFPGIYGKDYIYPTVEDFDYLKDKGFTLARIPFKWERIQDGLGGALREFDLAELKKAVTLAGERGIKVILDLHNYGRYYKDGNHSIVGTDGVGPEHLADL